MGTKASDGMSLEDKMSLWFQKAGSEHPEVDESDHLQGIDELDEEEDEEDFSPSELFAYKNAIFLDTAYNWLIGSLLKESSFHWNESQPHTMIDGIRKRILENLPKRRISRHKDPEIHSVTFWLPWRPLQQRVNEERHQGPGFSPTGISEIAVLTGTSMDQVQITTVK